MYRSTSKKREVMGLEGGRGAQAPYVLGKDVSKSQKTGDGQNADEELCTETGEEKKAEEEVHVRSHANTSRKRRKEKEEGKPRREKSMGGKAEWGTVWRSLLFLLLLLRAMLQRPASVKLGAACAVCAAFSCF